MEIQEHFQSKVCMKVLEKCYNKVKIPIKTKIKIKIKMRMKVKVEMGIKYWTKTERNGTGQSETKQNKVNQTKT